jgi:hypothetical protein
LVGGAIRFDAADEPLSLPYFAVHGLVEAPSGLKRRSVIRGVNPFGGPNFSGPVETIDSVSCHSCAPGDSRLYHRMKRAFNSTPQRSKVRSQMPLSG